MAADLRTHSTQAIADAVVDGYVVVGVDVDLVGQASVVHLSLCSPRGLVGEV